MSASLTIAEVFAVETWWVQVIKAVVLALVAFTFIPLAGADRAQAPGSLQHRYGPNRVGPFGSLQPAADILKLLGKENFRPRGSTAVLFYLAPALR